MNPTSITSSVLSVLCCTCNMQSSWTVVIPVPPSLQRNCTSSKYLSARCPIQGRSAILCCGIVVSTTLQNHLGQPQVAIVSCYMHRCIAMFILCIAMIISVKPSVRINGYHSQFDNLPLWAAWLPSVVPSCHVLPGCPSCQAVVPSCAVASLLAVRTLARSTCQK